MKSRSSYKEIKICILTSGHLPKDDRIYYKEALSLKDAGYNVKLIVPYDRAIEANKIEFITVSKPKNRFERFFITAFRILKRAIKENADIYHFHDPDLVWVGMVLKIIFNKKVIYDVHEDYPLQILEKEWLKFSLLRKIFSKLWIIVEQIASKFFDGIIAATPSIKERFENYTKNVIVVRNFAIYSLFEEITVESFAKSGDKLLIIYPGSLDEERGIDKLIESLTYLPDNVELLLLGRWMDKKFKKYCETLEGFKKTRYIGEVSMEEVYRMLPKADIGVILDKKIPKNKYGLPIKMFEYMAAGLAIVASDFDYWKKLFSECVMFVDPENVIDIASKIKLLLDNPKLRKALATKAKKLVEEKYNWENESEKMLKFYDLLAKN